MNRPTGSYTSSVAAEARCQIQAVDVMSSLFPSLISFSYFSFPGAWSSNFNAGFSFCFFCVFLAIFIVLSSQQRKKNICKLSPRLQTQIQAVDVLSSLFPSLISFSIFSFPGGLPAGFSISFFLGFKSTNLMELFLN